MRESRSYGSVGEPVGNHRLYPEEAGGAIPPPTRLGHRFVWYLKGFAESDPSSSGRGRTPASQPGNARRRK
jgi:hypothetical protein